LKASINQLLMCALSATVWAMGDGHVLISCIHKREAYR